MQPLRQIACKYYTPAVKAITARLEDSDWKVRKAALLALAEIVAQPDVQAATAVTDCLKKDKHYSVRRTAAFALSRTVEKGDREAFAALRCT